MFEILDKFKTAKILVAGDAMIDRYWWGDVSRISPEAPVPVVKLRRESLKPGGAANVAANIAGLGAAVKLVCGAGDDPEGGLFPEILSQNGIESSGVVTLRERRTTVKTRIVAHNQHVVRLDSETPFELSGSEEEEAFRRIEAEIEWADVLLLSDYAKGFLSENIIKRLITTCDAQGKIVLIDPKGSEYERYAGAGILTPNQSETAQAARFEIRTEDDLRRVARSLLERLNLQALLVTRGENGMSLFEKGGATQHLPATARSVYDVTGAGDTVIATLAVAVAAGADLPAAARLANTAAGLAVEEVGTSIVGYEKLRQTLLSKAA